MLRLSVRTQVLSILVKHSSIPFFHKSIKGKKIDQKPRFHPVLLSRQLPAQLLFLLETSFD